jgi:transcriptional regulator with XRE-family HTH domain
MIAVFRHLPEPAMSVLPDFESAEFAPALKAIRKQLQLSRTALAAQVGLSTAAIQRYEAQDGSNIKPSRDAYERLCKVLADLLQHSPAPAAVTPPMASPVTPVALPPVVRSEPLLAPGILLADATLEQLIARAKSMGAKKVTIEF